jgi:asparaginyl-tRNA synthetase
MSQHVYIEDLQKYEGEIVLVKGWLYHKRPSGKLNFLLVRDGTGIVQCVVVKAEVGEQIFGLCDHITQESSLIVEGKVRKDARAAGGCELTVSSITLVNAAQEYPITPKEHGIDFLLSQRHLWLRSSQQHAILKVRAEVIKAARDFFNNKGFTLMDAPIFTPAACEGTTTLFETQYFDEKAYLTQSGQLYMEAAAMAFGKVYCFGPTFRAEKSKTRRHLTEFWMIEPEVAFFDLNDDMDLAEEFIEYIVQQVVANRQAELKLLERDITKLQNIKRPFPRITYREALELLKKNGVEVKDGDDFGGDEETIISNAFDKPVMIHRYPAACKAFYMKNDPADPSRALCVDVIAPEGFGEMIGGGQREDDYDTMVAKLKQHNLPLEAFDWYLDLRKYGSVPHAGFGLGIERTVAWLCNRPHVRETIPFPRLMGRIWP